MSPRNATENRTGQRKYTWRDEDFWSVTTILSGGLPKPALINWAKKVTAEIAVNQFDTLRVMVESGDTDGAIDWLKRGPDRERDKGANLGSEIHAAIEAQQLGRPMPLVPLPVKVRMDGFASWLADFAPTFLAVESSVYSRAQHYAGTLDCIIELTVEHFGPDGIMQLAVTLGVDMDEPRDLRLLCDYKSNKKGIFPETAMQVAAYRRADFVALPDGTETPMPEVDGCAALWLRPDGGYEFLGLRSDDVVYRAFLFVKETFRWQKETKKTAILGAINAPVREVTT